MLSFLFGKKRKTRRKSSKKTFKPTTRPSKLIVKLAKLYKISEYWEMIHNGITHQKLLKKEGIK